MKVTYFKRSNYCNFWNMKYKHLTGLALIDCVNMTTINKKRPGEYSEPSQTSEMELFVKIVND